jgi:hypothetical protein
MSFGVRERFGCSRGPMITQLLDRSVGHEPGAIDYLIFYMPALAPVMFTDTHATTQHYGCRHSHDALKNLVLTMSCVAWKCLTR